VGPQGPKGDTGTAGATGPAGPKGDKGDGGLWDGIALPMAVGQWYTPYASAVTSPSIAVGQLRLTPQAIGRACVIDALAITVSTVATAGGVLRLGIYSFDPLTLASTLLVDAGTVDATTLGVKQITGLNVPVAAGAVIVLCAVAQVAGCSIRASGGGNSFISYATASSTLTDNAIVAWASVASTFTGALPPSMPALNGSTAGPRILLRAAS
jgi:hypothetical protein